MEFGSQNNINNLNSLGAKKVFNIRDLGASLYLDSTRELYTNVAADFVASSTEYLSIADGVGGDFDFGDAGTSFSVAGWVYFDLDDTSERCLISKYDTSVDDRSYTLYWASNELKWIVSPDGTFSADYGAGISDSNFSTGNWYFVVGTFDVSSGERRLRLYNTSGTKIGDETAVSTSTSVYSSAEDLRLGTLFVSGSARFKFDGGLDEWGVWNKKLSDSEIATLLNSGNGVTWSDIEGTDLATSTTDSGNLVAYWGLDEKTGTRADSSANGNHLTDNNTVTYRAGIASGLAEENGDAVSAWNDLSGKGNNLSSPGISNYPTVHESQSIYLDGTGDLVTITNGGALDFDNTQDYSFSLWYKTDSGISSGGLFGNGEYLIAIVGGLVYVVGVTTTCAGSLSTTSASPVNEWTHLVATYSSTDQKIYINGTDDSIGTPESIGNSTDDWVIGPEDSVCVSVPTFQGKIKDVRMYNRILTQEEITNLNNGLEISSDGLLGQWKLNGDVEDSTSNANDGTISGNPTYSNDVPPELRDARKSVLFDGTDDYFSSITPVTGISGTSDFYVAFWMSTTTAFNNYIMGTDFNNGWYVRVGRTTTSTEDGEITFKIDDGTNDAFAFSGSSTDVSDGSWHFVLMQVRSSRLEGYIDASQKVDLDSSSVGSLNTNLSVGLVAVNYYDGELDGILYGKGSLTQTEINNLYNLTRGYYGK